MQVKEPSVVMIDGRKMAYDEVSPANPKGTVLLLTGLGSKRLGWFHQMEVFGREYRTIALDHRDTGDSDYVDSGYTTADQADDAARVLTALGIQRTHVVGISMGGFVSLELTLRHPEMVDKLVLVSTSAGGATHVAPGPDMQEMLARREQMEVGERARQTYTRIMHSSFVQAHPEELDRIAETARYQPQQPMGYLRQLQACMGHDASARLEQIKVPTLVVHGIDDPLVPYGNGRYLAEQIRGARFVSYPATGHIPIAEQAEQFNRDVLDFLNN